MVERAFGLTTDLYELTMAAAYFENRIQQPAIFDLFVRRLPQHRSYLIAAGLEQVLDYLTRLRFKNDEIDYLREHPSFKKVSKEFFDYLAGFRFTGDVWAIPEGTVAFGMEPLLRVTAPIIEAQVVETFLLSTINFQTMIASKAARVVTAASGRGVIEFGTRRAHGTEAGLFAARAAYIGGCTGTSNVEAGHLFGIPTFGTLAHSFVMSFDNEDEAFRAFLKVFPETATVLVDTYDTIAAVKRLARDFGPTIPAVRLDSGDLCDLSKRVREILDEAGTELATSYDAPALSGAYKLAGLEENGRVSMRIKLSHDKATYPGAKQVWRFIDGEGKYARDVITLADEAPPDIATARSLLEPVMRRGRKIVESEAGLAGLNRLRERAAEELKRFHPQLLALDFEGQYPVVIGDKLGDEQEKLKRRLVPN
jgi:nicotinate phosphoribosyltransferase